MSGSVVDRDAVTNWLIKLLESDQYKYPVGDHTMPTGELPVWVVRSIPGGRLSGPPLTAPEADAGLVYQVDSVGRTRTQAERLAYRARRLIVGRGADGRLLAAGPSLPAGLAVRDRITDGAPGGVEVSGSKPNELYAVQDRYVIEVSAA